MMNRIPRTLLYALYELIFIGTVFLTLGCQTVVKAYTCTEFPFENAGYLIVGLAVIALVFYINSRFGDNIEKFFSKYSAVLLVATLGFLLFWQLYTCYGGYFLSGWDAGVIRNTVLAEFQGNYDQINAGYFSWFPNNVLIIWLFTGVTRFAVSCGLEHPEFAPVVFQCLLDVLAMWLVYRIAYEFTKSRRMAWLAYAVAYLFAGMSPWFIVAYTDATGIVFPVLLIRIYQLAAKDGRKPVKWLWSALLGFMAITAYHIKPQTVIPFIAVVLVELISTFGKGFIRKILALLPAAVCCIAGVIVAMAIHQAYIVPSLHVETDPETTIGWQHYIMMGLNDQTDGVYSGDDYALTESYMTNEERNAADLKEAENRLHAYGIKGLVRHFCRKQLVNYGDGTFAWGHEGGFFSGDPDWAKNRSSSFIRSHIETAGKSYNRFLSSKQAVWVTVLFLQLFVVFYKRKYISDTADKTIMVMTTSVIGLTIFELLFEARARYLFCFAPVFVILACIGLKNLYAYLKQHWSWKPLKSGSDA